jgi:hypothetical protein
VIFVDNLNDDGPGSFRDAVQQKGPRYILFRVGGTIHAQSEIAVVEPFCTIAGQTAPGDGICLVGGRLVVCTHDVILRGFRFRVGDGPGMPSTGRDNLTIGKRERATSQVIVDHCSCSWGVDESVSIFGEVRDVTLQWLLNAESLHESIHLDETRGLDAHSCALLIGPGACRVTVHSCLLAHHVYRNPRTGAEKLEFVNNLVYNWKSEGAAFSVPADRPMTIAFVGNIYRRGPSTLLRSKDGTDRPWGQFSGRKPGRLYLHNNLTDLPAFLMANTDNAAAIRVLDGAQAVLSESLVGEWPFPGSGVPVRTIVTVADLDYLLDRVGALAPRRDGVDARIIDEYRRGAGRIVDSPAQVGGLPVYRSGLAPADRDGDGLPDAWEQARRLNLADPADAAADADGNGYPEIDDFLNSFFPPV